MLVELQFDDGFAEDGDFRERCYVNPFITTWSLHQVQRDVIWFLATTHVDPPVGFHGTSLGYPFHAIRLPDDDSMDGVRFAQAALDRLVAAFQNAHENGGAAYVMRVGEVMSILTQGEETDE